MANVRIKIKNSKVEFVLKDKEKIREILETKKYKGYQVISFSWI